MKKAEVMIYNDNETNGNTLYQLLSNYNSYLSSKGLICYDFQEPPKCRVTAIEIGDLKLNNKN